MSLDPKAVARDWITIWQSELTASATDPELIEGFIRMVDQWARAAQASAALLPGPADGAGGRSDGRADGRADGRSDGRSWAWPPAGAAAAAAAPDARDAAIERLAERVAELERIIAGLTLGR
jgi:hypothetical protein